MEEILRDQAAERLLTGRGEEITQLVEEVARRELDPYTLVDRILAEALGSEA